jgi:cation-transporting ATPase 13A1
MLVLFECTVVKSRLRNVDELRELATPASSVLVLRSHRWQTLSSVSLLPGDIIALARSPASRMYGGQVETIVPADVVLIHGTVAINESSLTGESTPQLKAAVNTLGEDPSARLSMSTHRACVVLGGTKLLQHTSGDQARQMQPPGGGAVAVVLRTGFYSSQVRKWPD